MPDTVYRGIFPTAPTIFDGHRDTRSQRRARADHRHTVHGLTQADADQ